MEAAADASAESAALMPQGKETRDGRAFETSSRHSAVLSPDASDDELNDEPHLRLDDVISGGGAKELEFRFSFNVEGKGVLSGVASSGVGACAEGAKRAGGDGAVATSALWWRRHKLLAAAGALLVLLAVVATVVALLWSASRGGSSNYNGESPIPPTETQQNVRIGSTDPPTNPELLLENGQTVVARSEWSKVPPDWRRELVHPTPYVVVGHTAGPACRDRAHCFTLLRTYRDDHRTFWGQPDISYNFLIDVTGAVYEARGWDATNNHESWARRCNLGITFFGNFMQDKVTPAMMESLRLLLRLGVALGKLDANYRLVAQNQVSSTLSPGINLLREIEHWPHRCLEDCDEGVKCIEGDLIPQGDNRTANS